MAISLSKSKKAIFFVIAAGMLSTSFFFQNCSRGALNQPSVSTAVPPQTTAGEPTQKIELKNEQINQVDLNVDGTQTINQNGHQYSLRQAQTLSIDFTSGQFQVSTQPNQNYCLSQSLKSELAAILNTATICKKEVAAADTVCSQSVKTAYAEIHLAKDSYKLGLYSNNCSGEYVDLCDAQSEMLKGFAQSLKNNLSNLNCM